MSTDIAYALVQIAAYLYIFAGMSLLFGITSYGSHESMIGESKEAAKATGVLCARISFWLSVIATACLVAVAVGRSSLFAS
jgi:ribose/xylose/arabinose/galactoside ABC-type transport system permease subunit